MLVVPAMFGLVVPPSATLETLIDTLLPAAHASLVAAPVGGAAMLLASREFTIGVRIRRRLVRTLTVRGAKLTVAATEPKSCDVWISADEASAELFLADWKGPRRFVPANPPPSNLRTLTDPLLLSRIVGHHAKIELAITELNGKRASMMIGIGNHAKKGIDDFDPEVVVETSEATFLTLVAGTVTPEGVLADPSVKIAGKRLVAAQLALSLAPLFPRLTQ